MSRFLFSKTGIALTVFLAIAGYFLWTEHQTHVISVLPALLIVGGCILTHVFMHGGHGHGGHGNSDGPKHRCHDDEKGDDGGGR